MAVEAVGESGGSRTGTARRCRIPRPRPARRALARLPTLAGTSELWVSGFVATHLARRRCADRPGAHRRGPALPAWARRWLVVRRRGAHRRRLHRRCLSAVSDQIPDEESSRAREVLKAHSVDDSFATYRADSGIGDFVGSPPTGVPGWTGSHPDVAAAVLLAGVPKPGTPDEDRVLGRLVGSANATGLIPSYWWRGMLYASALRCGRCALGTASPRTTGRSPLRRARPGFSARMAGTGSAPTESATRSQPRTGCSLVPSAAPERRGTGQRAAEALIAMQRDDGSWRGDLVLRIPAPLWLSPGSWPGGTGRPAAGTPRARHRWGLRDRRRAARAVAVVERRRHPAWQGHRARGAGARGPRGARRAPVDALSWGGAVHWLGEFRAALFAEWTSTGLPDLNST